MTPFIQHFLQGMSPLWSPGESREGRKETLCILEGCPETLSGTVGMEPSLHSQVTVVQFVSLSFMRYKSIMNLTIPELSQYLTIDYSSWSEPVEGRRSQAGVLRR